jgi:adenylate kinase
MLREAVAKGTPIGLQAKAIMESGMLVPDLLVVTLISEAIQNNSNCRKGFILDGFPRTVDQAKLLDDLLKEKNGVGIDGIINLIVEDDLLIKRITGRLIHPASGRSYNTYFHPPVFEGKDDITQEPLIQRSDDTEEKLKTRLEEFHAKTTPVLEYYEKKVYNIPAHEENMELIAGRIREAIVSIQQSKQKQVL